jgi:ribonuclease J
VIDLYTAYVLDQLKNLRPGLPPHDKDRVRVYYMRGHAKRLADNVSVKALYHFMPRKISIAEIVKARADMVVKLPIWNGMERIAAAANKERPLQESQLIYSMWAGYLEKKSDVKDFCSAYGIGMKSIHTSGHAYLEDLKRLVKALNPSVLIPVHTLAGDSFSNHFPNVVRLDDGIAYEIN